MSDAENLASRLKERITIQQVSSTHDDVGGYTQSWSTHVACFAEVETLSGREQVIGAQREAQANYRITIRRRDTVTTAMRVQWSGMTLNIQGIAHTKTTTEILAVQGGEA